MTPEAGSTPDPALLALAVIPARLESRRLPRKMLLNRTGTYLFAHTAQSVARCASIARVVLATDSTEVLDAARGADIEALMTSADHASGTDRVFEAFRTLEHSGPDGRPWDVIVNVQGDEPDVAAEDLTRLIAAFGSPEVSFATLYAAIETEEEARDPSVVKVVCDARGDALYFSRAPIPTHVHARSPGSRVAARRHIGVYAFRPAALQRFCSLPQGTLEASESLEQLRWLEAGERLHTVEATHVPRGIDTQEDYEHFVRRSGAAKQPDTSDTIHKQG
jgi:3-deoxy-manno-octulosonate cytidylyltransferase (CMP-KDO synthetase)